MVEQTSVVSESISHSASGYNSQQSFFTSLALEWTNERTDDDDEDDV